MFVCCRSASCAQWDFFAGGRIYFLGEPQDKNVFRSMSDMARSGKVPPGTLIPNSEIVSILPNAGETEQQEGLRICASTRAAQRGPEVHANVLRHLLTTSRSISHGKLFSDGDQVVVVDVHPHAGCHAMASVILANEGIPVRHVLVKSKGRGNSSAVDYTLKRLGAFLAGKWLKHEVQLSNHEGKAVPPQSLDGGLSDEDRSYLKSIPGVWDAFEGVQSWSQSLKVCQLRGFLVLYK